MALRSRHIASLTSLSTAMEGLRASTLVESRRESVQPQATKTHRMRPIRKYPKPSLPWEVECPKSLCLHLDGRIRPGEVGFSETGNHSTRQVFQKPQKTDDCNLQIWQHPSRLAFTFQNQVFWRAFRRTQGPGGAGGMRLAVRNVTSTERRGRSTVSIS